MTPEKKDKKERKNQNAEEVAQAMAENMKANMENPNFLKEKEEMTQKVIKEVLKKRGERGNSNPKKK